MEKEAGLGAREGNNPKALINKTSADSPVFSGGESFFVFFFFCKDSLQAVH